MTATDINETYTIHDRNHDDAKTCMGKLTTDDKKGYIEKSLFSFIKFENIVVDLLHMTLRITDKLFEKLLHILKEIEKQTNDLTNKLKSFLEIECNISYPFIQSDTKASLRSLNQNERLAIFEKLFSKELQFDFEENPDDYNVKVKKVRPLCLIFPGINDLSLRRLNDIFLNFKRILNMIKSENYQELIPKLKIKLKKWLEAYILVPEQQSITPYIHIFCFHIPEFIQTHGNINLFSMQGLENLNSFSKINYFRQTNRNKTQFTSMLLEKMNRMNFYHLGGRLNIDEIDAGDEDRGYKDKYKDMFDFLNNNN